MIRTKKGLTAAIFSEKFSRPPNQSGKMVNVIVACWFSVSWSLSLFSLVSPTAGGETQPICVDTLARTGWSNTRTAGLEWSQAPALIPRSCAIVARFELSNFNTYNTIFSSNNTIYLQDQRGLLAIGRDGTDTYDIRAFLPLSKYMPRPEPIPCLFVSRHGCFQANPTYSHFWLYSTSSEQAGKPRYNLTLTPPTNTAFRNAEASYDYLFFTYQYQNSSPEKYVVAVYNATSGTRVRSITLESATTGWCLLGSVWQSPPGHQPPLFIYQGCTALNVYNINTGVLLWTYAFNSGELYFMSHYLVATGDEAQPNATVYLNYITGRPDYTVQSPVYYGAYTGVLANCSLTKYQDATTLVVSDVTVPPAADVWQPLALGYQFICSVDSPGTAILYNASDLWQNVTAIAAVDLATQTELWSVQVQTPNSIVCLMNGPDLAVVVYRSLVDSSTLGSLYIIGAEGSDPCEHVLAP